MLAPNGKLPSDRIVITPPRSGSIAECRRATCEEAVKDILLDKDGPHIGRYALLGLSKPGLGAPPAVLAVEGDRFLPGHICRRMRAKRRIQLPKVHCPIAHRSEYKLAHWPARCRKQRGAAASLVSVLLYQPSIAISS